jgi:hypothetical protein
MDPFIKGHSYDAKLYDFGLVFEGYGPHRTAKYRMISANDALIMAGISTADTLTDKVILGSRITRFSPDSKNYDFGLVYDGYGTNGIAKYHKVSINDALIISGIWTLDSLPVKVILGNNKTWSKWKGTSLCDTLSGNLKLKPGKYCIFQIPVDSLEGKWLVYNAYNKKDIKTPMRLQVNWLDKGGIFITCMIQVVYPDDTLRSYFTFLKAPPGAKIGEVYATLEDGAKGEVELKSIELK